MKTEVEFIREKLNKIEAKLLMFTNTLYFTVSRTHSSFREQMEAEASLRKFEQQGKTIKILHSFNNSFRYLIITRQQVFDWFHDIKKSVSFFKLKFGKYERVLHIKLKKNYKVCKMLRNAPKVEK